VPGYGYFGRLTFNPFGYFLSPYTSVWLTTAQTFVLSTRLSRFVFVDEVLFSIFGFFLAELAF
jgi:hypothetical protein